jgi:hypothetical protein
MDTDLDKQVGSEQEGKEANKKERKRIVSIGESPDQIWGDFVQ